MTLVLDQPRAGRGTDMQRPAVSAPLRIGPVDDPLEHEANRVAERLVASPAPGGLLQRTCACGGTPGPDGECAECKAKRLGLQRRASGTGPALAPPGVHHTLSSPGRPLERWTRSFFEQRLGRDLGSVRVHTDSQAASSAEAVGALAYTVGKDVVFAPGCYSPQTQEGQRLLAHELAHTVQQGGAGVLRRLVRVQSPATAAKIAGEFNTICPGVGFGSSGQVVTGECRESSTLGCECVCDVVNDSTRNYEIMLSPAKASTQTVTLHDGSTQVIPESSVWPHTVHGTDPFIETYEAAGSGIEFGFFRSRGGASWYSPWRILAHELCGHGRLGQTYSGGAGNRPGHDATIDTENQIAGEHGEPARGHFGDPRQGEAFFNPIGDRSKVAFSQTNGWHYEAP